MINLWTKYGESSLYGYGETDLITKNIRLLMPMFRLQWRKLQGRLKSFENILLQDLRAKYNQTLQELSLGSYLPKS